MAFLLPRENLSNQPAGVRTPIRTVLKILLLQLGVGGACALLAWPFAGPDAAWQFFLGTLVGVIPNAYLGMRIAGFGKATDAQSMLRAAWLGEIGKLALTILLLVAVFTLLRPTRPGWLLVGFVVSQLSNWPALYLFRRD